MVEVAAACHSQTVKQFLQRMLTSQGINQNRLLLVCQALGFIALPTIMLRWPASTDSDVRRLAPVALYGSILRPDAMFSIWADFVEREDDGDVFRVL